MATVSCKGTLTWRGKQFTVGQNRHKGMYGSAWIEGLQDDAVNPSDFPGSWRTTLQSTGLPDGTTDNKFMLELKFVEFLRLEGERPLKAFDQVVVTRRLRKLTTKFGQAEVDSVYKSPK